MPAPLIQEQTLKYKTYLKRSLVEALQNVFASHPDSILRQHTNVSLDLPLDRSSYPAIVVRFYERDVHNMGVSHVEYIQNDNGQWQPYKHFMYTGDAEFAIYALSSYDRDIMADSLVEVLTMSDLEMYTNYFNQRIYDSNANEADAFWNYINVNSDRVSGFGESQVTPPWGSEDMLIYQTSYRVGIMGEFYSRTLETSYGLVEKVPMFPYFGADEGGGDPIPQGDPSNPSPWMATWREIDPSVPNDEG